MAKLTARIESIERALSLAMEKKKSKCGPVYAVLFDGDSLRKPYTPDGKYWLPRWGYVAEYKTVYIVKYESSRQAWAEIKALWERHGDALDLNHLQGERREAVLDIMDHEFLGERLAV